jgi:suppressor of G2 allele of SKP1
LELKLRKLEGLQWSSLETPGIETLKQPSKVDKKPDEDSVHKYPSSAHYTRDWDKVVAEVKKEEKDEKPEGDAALNQLFQQIYKDGNDEVRKAMNKSFVSL